MKNYNSQEIEKKWQKYWEEHNVYRTFDKVKGKENYYTLSEFAYPSGNLHVGHWYAFAVPDIYARYKRMQGYNVLYPIGFDAFGLPAENAAIKRNLDPKDWTYKNMAHMEEQLKSMGASFDWERKIATSDPEYYKWTQWMFTKFYEHGIVKQINTKTNWCDSCKTVLANEQVVGGKCERCDTEVVQKDMKQWAFKITDFADALIDDLDELDWDNSIKQAQREWIGRKEGSEISFSVKLKQEEFCEKILIATNNKSKKERVKKLLEKDEIKTTLFSPQELGFGKIETEENGSLQENALKKAMAYFGKVDFPIIANDASLVIEGVDLNPLKVKRNAIHGEDESKFTQEEISKKILDFYLNIIKEKGGKIDAYWHEAWTIVFPDGETKILEAKREVTLTQNIHGEVDPYFPLRSLYFSKATGKYHAESNEEDYIKEMESVSKLLKSLIKKNKKINIFTTRVDTLYGVTYVVLAPEHSLIQELKEDIENWDEVEAYLKETEKKSELERQQSREKTGVALKGISAINPVNGEEISVWVADYVLAHFGTGAVMAVPTHDERDAEFALKYDLPFRFVVLPSAGEQGKEPELLLYGETDFIKEAGAGKKGQEKIQAEWNAFYDFLNEVHDAGGMLPKGKRICSTHKGRLINSDQFSRMKSYEAIPRITEFVGGKMKKTYRLRDWGISRQRYWGTPIPIVYDPEGNAHPIPEEHLPWLLPEDVDHRPDGTAPLARSKELKERTENIFGKGWTPEVDTMDTFVDSSWYFYRYLDAKNDKEFASKDILKNWMPVDMYFGGAEHTTMHLLYSRFWAKALYKLGFVERNEPYKGRLNRGLILGPDGAKMSKSKGNVIDPDAVVAQVGADTVRMYLAFIGPFNEPGNYPWDPNGVVGVRRFIERVYALADDLEDRSSESLLRALHKTIKKVIEDVERLKLNTAISTMMVWVKLAEKEKLGREDYRQFLKLFAIFAPHMAEEIWQENLGEGKSIHLSDWPVYEEKYLQEDSMRLPVQINGKVRAQLSIDADIGEEELRARALAVPEIQKWIAGKEIKKFIYIKGRIVNIVV